MGRFAEQFLPQPLQFWATHIGQLFKCFRAFVADFHRSTPGGKGTFIADPIAALVGRPVSELWRENAKSVVIPSNRLKWAGLMP